MDAWRLALIALTIIMEARNQPELGKRMIAEVILNRGGQERVEQVVFQDRQFAVWAADLWGPEHSIRLAVLECVNLGAFPSDPWCVERMMEAKAPGWERRFEIGTAEYWEAVWQIAVESYEGGWTPPPELAGKRHFDNPAFWPDGLPPWLENCEKVGDHVFCD